MMTMMTMIAVEHHQLFLQELLLQPLPLLLFQLPLQRLHVLRLDLLVAWATILNAVMPLKHSVMVMAFAPLSLGHNHALKVQRVFVLTQIMRINPIVGANALQCAMRSAAAGFQMVPMNQTSATMPVEAIVVVQIQVVLKNHGPVLAVNVIVNK
jgi:hypothetical protein